MYFKDFPQFLYDFNYGDGQIHTSVVRDITRNVRVKKEILSNVVLYEEYDIVDGETPEIIAEKFYGSPEYHWVIMLANDKYDYRKDFPMVESVLQRHIESKYNPTKRYSGWEIRRGENPRGGNITFAIPRDKTDPTLEPEYMTAPVTVTLSGTTTDSEKFEHSFQFLNETQTGYDSVKDMFLQYLPSGVDFTGEAAGFITVNTVGREHNPVHFVNNLGYRVNPSPNAIPVSGDKVYREDNDRKRRIKIISPALLETIIKNYEELLR